MDDQTSTIFHELESIKQRNKRVEADKAWETSKIRTGSICAITYIISSLVMLTLGAPKPFLNALIPTVGFFLSTQSLPFVKGWWVQTLWEKKIDTKTQV